MADEQDFSKREPSEEERAKREQDLLERARKSRRMYYHRNKHWTLEEARKKRAKERRRRQRLAKASPLPPKPVKPAPTPEEREARKQARLEAARRAREEWAEIGWIVAKMNIEAKMSQDEIYRLLGGMVAKRKIAHFCAQGKKRGKLKPPR
jgi:hypothetical protein